LNKEEGNTDLVNDGNTAIHTMETEDLALTMTEVMVLSKNGTETTHSIRKIKSKLAIIVLRLLGKDKELILEVFNSDVSDFTPKLFNLNELAIRVEIILL
jgi:DNA-binding response OmpR family regulator